MKFFTWLATAILTTDNAENHEMVVTKIDNILRF